MLTLTFGTDSPTVAAGDTITIGSGTIMDWGDTVTALGSPPAITGSADVSGAPRLLSAEADDESGLGPGAQEGDTVVLTFDRSTNGYPDIDSANVDTALHIYNKEGAAWGVIDTRMV